jgi:hypothetical protein
MKHKFWDNVKGRNVKSWKIYNYSHEQLAGTIQKMHQIQENAKCRNVKSGVHCSTSQQPKSLLSV